MKIMKTRWIIILGILIILIIAMEIYYFTKNQLSSIVFNGSIKVGELIQEGKLIIPNPNGREWFRSFLKDDGGSIPPTSKIMNPIILRK